MNRVPPPVLALAAGFAQRGLTGRTSRPGPVRTLTAVMLAAAASSTAGAAARQFRRRGTTVDPLQPERASVLVTSGPNSVTRNPMYVGLAGLLAAHALWRGGWWGWVPVIGFVAVIDRLQIAAEEVALTARFGADYEAYRSATPRWLGLRSLRPPRR